MNQELISIIMPTYNSELFLINSLESILKQTYSKFELIVVDDCSKDNTVDILKKYSKQDKRIKYIVLNENSGAAVARNKGIDNAKGRYIAFIDSDDLWSEKKLEIQLKFMKKEKKTFTYTDYIRINEKGKYINKIVVPKKVKYHDLLKNTIIGCSTVIIDKEAFSDIKMPLVRKGQDTATWLKLLKETDYAYGLNHTLTTYTERKGSISSNKFSALRRTWNLYRKNENMGRLRTLYYFSHYFLNAVFKRVKIN